MINLLPSAKEPKHNFALIGLLIITAQSTSLWFLVGASGLDASYDWLHSYSINNGIMNKAGFIGVFGPLGFLDRSYPDFYVLASLSILWRILSNILFYLLITKLLRSRLQNSLMAELCSILIVTFASQIVPASMTFSFSILGYALILYINKRHVSRYILLFYIFVSAFMFLFKLFQFSLVFVGLSVVSLMYLKQFKKRQTQFFIILSVLALTAVFTSAILALLGFTWNSGINWLIGYLEISSGYTEMSIEETGRLWEYGAVLVLTIWILVTVYKNTRDPILLFLIMVSIYLAFRYGFNRHDAHSTVTFLYLFFLSIIVSFTFRRKKDFIGVVSILILISVSNVNTSSFLDILGRTQTNSNLLKMLDPGYRSDLQSANLNSLQQSNPIDQRFLDEINGKQVAVLPWATGINKAWGLGIVAPPVPSLFSAYTTKLDNINTDWLLSEEAPEFILMNKPSSIDGRFPFWDSPKFQATILCNYDSTLSDDFLLLLKRVNAKCNISKTVNIETSESGTFYVNANPNEIILGRLNMKEMKIDKFLLKIFKKPRVDYLSINGNRYRIVSKTPENLILAVGSLAQMPGVWNLGQKQTYQIPKGWSMTVTRILINK